jgi:tetratricopeptide (TPR) repeat protein
MAHQKTTPDGFPLVRSIFLILLALAVYWPSMRGEFLWDDDVLVTGNQHVQRSDGLKNIWLGRETPDYFPLTMTVFWLEWRLFGMNPTGYHVVNVLLHGLAAVLLWRVLMRLKIPGAFAGAAIFAVHPVCVASVAWIAELKNTLSLVFFLLAFLFYLRFEQQTPATTGNASSNNRPAFYVLSLVTFLLGLLSKTSVVVLPPLLLGLALWQRGRIDRRDVIRATPFFLLALALGIVTIMFQSTYAFSNKSDPLLVRTLGGGMAVWFYLWKAVMPVNLSMVYPRWEINASSVVVWLPWVACLAAIALLWKFRKTWGRPLLFAFGYFIVTLAPVLGIFNMSFFVFSRVADHLVYLSLISLTVLAAAILATKWPRHFKMASTVIVGVLAVLTWNRAQAFATSEKLWTDTLKKNPQSWAAHNHLGEAVVARGDLDGAIELFESAARLNPDYSFAHYNLGNAYLIKGDVAKSISGYQNAIRVWPDYAEADNGWGLALMQINRVDEAMEHFQKALKVAPFYVDAHYNMGAALCRKAQFAKATEHFRAALETSPDHVPARIDLAISLSQIGKLEEATNQYHELLNRKADSPEAHNGLGMIMLTKNLLDKAEQHFRQAVQLAPQDAITLSNLGEVLLRQRKHEEGIMILQRANQLAPEDQAISMRLAQALGEAGK